MTDPREWRPRRPNSARLKCGCCDRVFAAGQVPAPEKFGPYAGRLLCRDCRHGLDAAADPLLL